MTWAICGTPQTYESTVSIPMPNDWVSDKVHRSFTVDACIWPEIHHLVHMHGIRTLNSCCGHGFRHMGPWVIVAEDSYIKMAQLGYKTQEDRPDMFTLKWPVTHISVYNGVMFKELEAWRNLARAYMNYDAMRHDPIFRDDPLAATLMRQGAEEEIDRLTNNMVKDGYLPDDGPGGVHADT